LTSSSPSPEPARTATPTAGRPGVAVLVKQVPSVADIPVRTDGRLDRAAAAAEINPHCRRALAKGIELARSLRTSCTVLTLGPPGAESVLTDALRCGAERAVLISDPRLAGSDTLATARALAAALALTGPYDLVLTGRNSVDSDTGHVGAQVAELAGLAFAGPAREIELDDTYITVRCELDDGWRTSKAWFPVVVSCAERLCPPARPWDFPEPQSPEALASLVQRLTADDLGPGPWGQAGSPTVVERIDTVTRPRNPAVASGISDNDLDRLVAALREPGTARTDTVQTDTVHTDTVQTDTAAPDVVQTAPVAEPPAGARSLIAVLAEPGQPAITRELLGGAAGLAGPAGARVAVIADPADLSPDEAGSWGADEAVVIDGAAAEAAFAVSVASWCGWRTPAVLLAPSTNWGREIAARTAARLGAGLVGDAISVGWEHDSLRCEKAVAGGSQVALIRCTSAVQMATVRPGVFPLRPPRRARIVPALRMTAPAADRVSHTGREADADAAGLGAARVVIGVGTGVDAADYPLVQRLCDAAGAQLVATRRVTDTGLVPQHRQVGLTGRSLAPDVYLALGLSGKPNHMIGVRRASFIAAVNTDPSAPVFASADLGIVADWRDVARALISRLEARRPEQVLAAGANHAR
jgi:electron transfer flavoprotein alpha subunit